jgi:serine protease
VLDTGIVMHPEFSGRILPGYDFVSDAVYANDGDGRDASATDPGDWVSASDRTADATRFADCSVEDSSWHGTIIAGQLIANWDSAGTAGMLQAGQVLPVRVAGKCGADVEDIVEGMRWAAGLSACKRDDGLGGCLELAPANPNPARILNISFGGTGSCAVYQTVLDDLRLAGVVVVAAAGNEYGAATRPAKCPGAVGVAALNRDGFKTNYSNFDGTVTLATLGGDDGDGAWGSLQDGGLLTPDPCTAAGLSTTSVSLACSTANQYRRQFGTSFSSPLVAGAAALMLAVNPALSYSQLVQGLRSSARPHVVSGSGLMQACSSSNPGRCLCTTSTCGAGILDVPQALLYAQQPATYTPPVRQPADIDTDALRALVQQSPQDRPANAGGGGGETWSGSNSGGGAASPLWLLALAALLGLLARRRRA